MARRAALNIVVLAAHWESKSEEGWVTRQVAGALACAGDVHVITPEAPVRRGVDGAFTLHQLGSPVAPASELRRDLLVEALSHSDGDLHGGGEGALEALLDKGLIEPWNRADGLLEHLSPDLVLIAGHRNVGALAAVKRALPSVPVLLLALGIKFGELSFPRFAGMFDQAGAILAVTENERQAIIESGVPAAKIHRVGAPLTANPSALTEPNGWVGTSDYIVVVTNSRSDEDHVDSELSRLIRLRFPDNPVGICHTDAFSVWHQGRLNEGWAVERSSDMARLMAWATMTVDLHPGPLFARRCLDSLLYGTPIVIPADSRGREHAERGSGGLWFEGPSELIWCIEAMLDRSTRDTFGSQGRLYAETEFGSTDGFIDRVLSSCGLDMQTSVSPVVSQRA